MTNKRIAIFLVLLALCMSTFAWAQEPAVPQGKPGEHGANVEQEPGKEAAHAEEAEHHETIWQTLGKWFNFAALAYLLYLFLGKTMKVQDRFKEDYHQIERSIESARQAKEEAERRLAELDERMAKVGDEINKLKQEAAREAEEEKKRILESAHHEAQRLIELAHKEIDSEVELAKQELRKQVADLAVKQGYEIVKSEIEEQDQKRLIREYIESFGK